MRIGDRVRYVGPTERWAGLEGTVSGLWINGPINIDFDDGQIATHVSQEHIEMVAKPMIPTGPQQRALVAATRAAVKNGNLGCSVMLTNGDIHDFVINEVLDDCLLGSRKVALHKACMIQFTAIAMIEFG